MNSNESAGFTAPRRSRALDELDLLLKRLEHAKNRPVRLDALVELVAWWREDDDAIVLVSAETQGLDVSSRHRRFAVLVGLLERSPEARESLAQPLHAVLHDTRALGLFAEGGLANDRGLLKETLDRISRRLLPRPRDEHELTQLVPRLFPDGEAVRWLATIPPELFVRFARLLEPDAEGWAPVRTAMGDAVCLIATRVETLGLAEPMRARRSNSSVRASAFYRLPRSTDAYLASLGVEPTNGTTHSDAALRWYADVNECRRGSDEVLEHLESSGVSVDVVYAIEVIGRHLDRMELLFAARAAPPGATRAATSHALLHALVHGRLNDTSLRSLLRENLRLLARKVIERTGKTGEHYIATTRREWFRMLGSAAGGGVVTTFTAAFKILIVMAHFPPFVELMLASINYSLSFALIQIFGFTLATKQPGMTAATLAGILKRARGPARVEVLVSHTARVVRSQLAAAFGNVVAVTIGAVIFEKTWGKLRGEPFLSPEKVDHVLASLDPFHSLTIFYAAITGVLLWFSGLCAGWVGNWTVYRRIPTAIAEHRLGARFGPHRMQRAARWFSEHISGIGGSVALGVLLALVPAIGTFTGLPLDVRHVTLSTGQLALAATELGFEGALHDPRVHAAMIGIAVIFVVNLGVSFLLALAIAARARGSTLADFGPPALSLAKRIVTRPHEFLFPPRDPTPSKSTS